MSTSRAATMPMTPECVVAYLGIVRAGRRVVSIADSFSPEELRKRMDIAEASLVVTSAGTVEVGEVLNRCKGFFAARPGNPASQGNKCRSCRKCWDRNTKRVIYGKH